MSLGTLPSVSHSVWQGVQLSDMSLGTLPSVSHSVCQGVQLSDISLGTLPSVTLCARVYNCQTSVLGHFLLSLCVTGCTIVRHQSWDVSFCPSVCQSVQLSQTSLRARPQDSLLPEEDVKKPKKQAKPSSILMSCNQYPSFHNFQVLKSTWQSVFCVIVKSTFIGCTDKHNDCRNSTGK